MSVVIIRSTAMAMACVMSMRNGSKVNCSDGQCVCLWDFYGETCTENCSDDVNCNGHGTCIAGGIFAIIIIIIIINNQIDISICSLLMISLSIGKCICDEGFSGENCDYESTILSKANPSLIITLVLLAIAILQLYLWRRQSVGIVFYCGYDH